MSLFSRNRQESVTNPSPREVRAGQSRARLADANASTRPNKVTVAELRKR